MTDTPLDRVRASARDIEDVAGDAGGSAPDLPPPTDAPPPDPPAPAFPDDRLQAGARLPLNDTGNGQRFAIYFGADALVVPRVGWHTWDGRRWKLDPDDIGVRRLAQKVQAAVLAEVPHLALEDGQAREVAREAELVARRAGLDAIPSADRSPQQAADLDAVIQRLDWIATAKRRLAAMEPEHRKFAKTTGNSGRIDALLGEATVELARDVETLDSDPLCVNTETGLLRFQVSGGGDAGYSRTADVRLEPHAREATVTGGNAPQYITKMMPMEYDPSATCPTFDAYLQRIQPQQEMREFLQRWFGLSMTALTGEQKFAFLYGDGANGKSVLVDLMGRMLGDYSATAKIESLTGRNRRGGGDATPDLMPLVGARMVRASEPEEGERLQEGTIKELTGGEPVLVRKLHADFVEVRPHFKLTISGNHKPDIRGTDDGIWRRVLLVPFDVQIPKAERDEALGAALWRERSGIFNWLRDGLLDYLKGGLREPAQVLQATDEYRADSNPAGTFLAESCLVSGDPADFLTARDLMDGFNLWLDQRGEGMWGERTVSLKFRKMAGRWRDPGTGKTFSPGKMKVTGYRGIRFQDAFAIAFEDAPRNASGHPVAATGRGRGGAA